VATKPAQLHQVVAGLLRPPGHARKPRQAEHRPVPVGLVPGAEELGRLDLEPRLLGDLPPQAGDGVLPLVQEAARDIPETGSRIVAPAAEEHALVPLDERLGAWNRVGPVALAAGRTAEVIVDACEFPAATGTEPPVVERTHEEDMMDNPDPSETEQELAGTERHAEEEDMRGRGADDDTLPTEDDE
jgi:hypothetical protein